MDIAQEPIQRYDAFAKLWMTSLNTSGCIDTKMCKLMEQNLDVMGAKCEKFAYQNDGILRYREKSENWDGIKRHYSLYPQNLENFSKVATDYLSNANLNPFEVKLMLQKLDKAIKNLTSIRDTHYAQQPAKKDIHNNAIKYLTIAQGKLKNLDAINEDLKENFKVNKQVYLQTIEGELQDGELTVNQERAKIFSLVHSYGIIDPKNLAKFTPLPQKAKATFAESFDRLCIILNQFEDLASEGKSERYLSACLIRHHELQWGVKDAQKMHDDLFEVSLLDVVENEERILIADLEQSYVNEKAKDLKEAQDAQARFVNELATFINVFSEASKGRQTFVTLIKGLEDKFAKHEDLFEIYKELENKPAEASRALALYSENSTLENSGMSQETKDILIGSSIVGTALTAATVVGVIFPFTAPYLVGGAILASPAMGLAVTGNLSKAKATLFELSKEDLEQEAEKYKKQFSPKPEGVDIKEKPKDSDKACPKYTVEEPEDNS